MHIEDVRVGSWVLITGVREKLKKDEPELTHNSNVQTIQHQGTFPPIKPFEPNGIPIKVLAKSYPFLVGFQALEPDTITVINSNQYIFVRASTKYVRRFQEHYNKNLLRLKPQPYPLTT